MYNRQNFLHDLVLEMANVKVKYEAKGKDGKGFRLNIVNAIVIILWIVRSFRLTADPMVRAVLCGCLAI